VAEGEGSGTISGHLQGANHPRSRVDKTALPDVQGAITTGVWLNDVVCVGTGEIRPRDDSGAARSVVGGGIDFVIEIAQLVWEPID
jgi:hypothetical protein